MRRTGSDRPQAPNDTRDPRILIAFSPNSCGVDSVPSAHATHSAEFFILHAWHAQR